jgi:hypothetical protein
VGRAQAVEEDVAAEGHVLGGEVVGQTQLNLALLAYYHYVQKT